MDEKTLLNRLHEIHEEFCPVTDATDLFCGCSIEGLIRDLVIDEACQKNDTQAAELARLKEALKPFAAAAHELEQYGPDDGWRIGVGHPCQWDTFYLSETLTMANLRRALAFFEEYRPPE